MSLQQDVRHYVRVARKSNQTPLSFTEFNEIHGTKLPVDNEAERVFAKFTKSLKRARLSNGVPVQTRLFNIYSALRKDQSPAMNIQPKRALVPEPTQSLNPVSSRSLQTPAKKAKIEVALAKIEVPLAKIEAPLAKIEVPLAKIEAPIEPVVYTVDHFKEDLKLWKQSNPQSKLNVETQVVYFVPPRKVDNFEQFATKLTKSTGAILVTGGTFKMRSGLKKQILGMEQNESKKILDLVKNGVKGPYFLPMACQTGSEKCICN
jgi:hypothetical protein